MGVGTLVRLLNNIIQIFTVEYPFLLTYKETFCYTYFLKNRLLITSPLNLIKNVMYVN